MSSELKNKFFLGVLWSAGDKFFIQLGHLAATLYIAKLIGPESFGLVGMLTIFTLFAESIVNNGLSQALVQKSNSITDEDKSTIFWVNLCWGVGIYIVLYLCAPLIAQFYNEPQLLEASRILFLIVIINSLTVVVRAQLVIKVDFKSQAVVNAIAMGISSTIGVFMALQGYSHWALIWLLIIKSASQNIGLWVCSNWVPTATFSVKAFRGFFKFGSNLMIAGFLTTFVNHLYIALVGRYFNAASVGYFTQATNLTNFLSEVIASTMQKVTYPILTSIKEDTTRLVAIYKKTISLTMLASLPALIGFAAVADTFVRLVLGDKWVASIPIIQILCFARALTPISNINMNILNAVGRSDLFMKVDLCKLPIIVITLMVSINFGIEAIALALLLNVFLSFFINAYFPGRLFGLGAWYQIKIAKNYIVASFIMFTLLQFITIDLLWLDLVVSVIIGVIVYVSFLILLKDKMLKILFSELKNKDVFGKFF